MRSSDWSSDVCSSDLGGTLIDNGLSLGTLPGGGSSAVIQTSVAGQVNLINANGLFLNFWDGAAGPKFDDAINGGDGLWQSGAGNNNWTDGGGSLNAPYQDAGFAVFSRSEEHTSELQSLMRIS